MPYMYALYVHIRDLELLWVGGGVTLDYGHIRDILGILGTY
jgi:hypothetical protein